MFSICSLCRPEREPAAAPAAAAAAAAPSVAPQQQALFRSKSEARIIVERPGSLSEFTRSQSMPSSTLLEAAKRRLQAAAAAQAAAEQQQQAAGDGATAMSFVQQYMQAIKEGNTTWATAEGVGALFAGDATMVAADRTTWQGREAILRRLNDGVAQLVKAMGGASESQLPTFEVEGPAAGPGGVVVGMRFKRGVARMQLTLTFRMQQGRIAHLVTQRA